MIADGFLSRSYSAQQSLYFFPLPQLQGSSGFGLLFLDPQPHDINFHLAEFIF